MSGANDLQLRQGRKHACAQRLHDRWVTDVNEWHGIVELEKQAIFCSERDAKRLPD
jgi:hypothetical protein